MLLGLVFKIGCAGGDAPVMNPLWLGLTSQSYQSESRLPSGLASRYRRSPDGG